LVLALEQAAEAGRGFAASAAVARGKYAAADALALTDSVAAAFDAGAVFAVFVAVPVTLLLALLADLVPFLLVATRFLGSACVEGVSATLSDVKSPIAL
jgi:hypothetical protein